MRAAKKRKTRSRSVKRGRRVRAARRPPKIGKAKKGTRKTGRTGTRSRRAQASLSRVDNSEQRDVEIDEERERAGGNEKAFDLEPDGAVDGVAEELGEGYVRSVTSGEQAAEDIRDEELPEEEGGPFVQTTGWTEFAHGVDASNPADAEPADLPTVSPYRRK